MLSASQYYCTRMAILQPCALSAACFCVADIDRIATISIPRSSCFVLLRCEQRLSVRSLHLGGNERNLWKQNLARVCLLCWAAKKSPHRTARNAKAIQAPSCRRAAEVLLVELVLLVYCLSQCFSCGSTGSRETSCHLTVGQVSDEEYCDREPDELKSPEICVGAHRSLSTTGNDGTPARRRVKCGGKLAVVAKKVWSAVSRHSSAEIRPANPNPASRLPRNLPSFGYFPTHHRRFPFRHLHASPADTTPKKVLNMF